MRSHGNKHLQTDYTQVLLQVICINFETKYLGLQPVWKATWKCTGLMSMTKIGIFFVTCTTGIARVKLDRGTRCMPMGTLSTIEMSFCKDVVVTIYEGRLTKMLSYNVAKWGIFLNIVLNEVYTLLPLMWQCLDPIGQKSHQQQISCNHKKFFSPSLYIFTNPFCTRSIFQVEYNGFEFRVFLLPDQLKSLVCPTIYT